MHVYMSNQDSLEGIPINYLPNDGSAKLMPHFVPILGHQVKLIVTNRK